ncbi:MAG: class I SAM-dependent methyltransferase [Vicinamibacterales bacterium]
MSAHTRRAACRACGTPFDAPFLALGPMPLANNLPRSPEELAAQARYPLDVCVCRTCSLVQTPDVIDPRVLFAHYVYLTGMSETMRVHNRAYAAHVVGLTGAGAGDLVVDIASNDGSLLLEFQPHGVRTLGIEPAANVADIARGRGVDTVTRFFDDTAGRDLRDEHGPAAAVLANNVLAHVDDPVGFLRGAGRLIGPRGLVVIEAPYVAEMLDRLEYDTIYHEHLSYFSIGALARLADEAGLVLVRVDHVPIHGGSLRAHFGHPAAWAGHGTTVSDAVARERAQGLADVGRYARFAEAVHAHRQALRALVGDLAAAGHVVAGYGAPAKATTLLNFCGLGPEAIAFTVDRNPLKVGAFVPGVGVPILDVDALASRRPDYALIFPWNLAAEIAAQQQAYREQGGQFLLPLPEPRPLAIAAEGRAQ